MPTPILATKLFAPPVRAGVIHRCHLVERIHAGQEGKLTLISAPAGFGKSTLVSSWVLAQKSPVAWLSLDDNDKEPYRLLGYIIAAIQTVQPQFAQPLMAALNGPNIPDIDMATTELINELHRINQVTLVLDDLHSAQSEATNGLLQQLVTYLPSTVSMIISTREKPCLQLAKLRAKGDLTELSATDLRFTTPEIGQYLNQSMLLAVPAQGIAALEQTTEGWIAGLQLAALSLRAHVSLDDLLVQLKHGHAFIVEYLLEDVLLKQPAEIQDFLLKTAVLGRFCASLCDALVHHDVVNDLARRPSSQATLERIEQDNLFVVPLDAERKWFRYHHLFAELLRQRLRKQMPEQVAKLHRLASHWFLAQGLELEAFEHAAAANDSQLALHIINAGLVPLQFRGGVFPIISWLETLAAETLNSLPELWVTWASSLLALGRVDGVLEKANAAELALSEQPVNHDLEILGRIASIRASVAVTSHDQATILEQAQIALKHLNPSSLAARAPIIWATGYAHALGQKWQQAEQAYLESLAICQQIGFITIGNMCRLGLAKIWLQNLQLKQVATISQEVIELAGDRPPPTTCDAYLALAMAFYQWDELAQAEHFAEQALPLAQQVVNTDRAVCCQLFIAQLALARGEFAQAEQQLTAAAETIQKHRYDLQRAYLASLQTRLAIHKGDYPTAAYWAEQHPCGHYRLLVLVAMGDIDKAQQLLNRQQEVPTSTLEQVQWLLVQARVSHAANDPAAACAHLANAIDLAEPHQALRLFLDEGHAITPLLEDACAAQHHSRFSSQLLQRLEQPRPQPGTPKPQNPRAQRDPWADAITKRELEVLRLIAQGLSNQEISERLHRALSTIKGHNKSIFEKLAVQRRTEAIAKARQLGLIEK